MGLDFFRLEELTPSSSSAFSSSSTESDMCYGQSLLQPGEWIITKETPKLDGIELLKVYFKLSDIVCKSYFSLELLKGFPCGSEAKSFIITEYDCYYFLVQEFIE